MKKYLFPLVMLSALLPCTAQDTVRWDDPWYLFNQKPVHTVSTYCHFNCDQTIDINDSSDSWSGRNSFYEQKYYLSKGRPVYGLAVTACFSASYPPTVYLHQQDSNGAIFLVDSIVQAQNNVKYCNFDYEYYYPCSDDYLGYTHPYAVPRIVTVPCMELYFETPQQVEDTILLGLNPNNFESILPEDHGRVYYVWDIEERGSMVFYSNYHPTRGWITVDRRFKSHGTIFPIVELRCRGEAPVARVEETGSGWARVSWPPDYVEEDYQVGVGRYGTEPADSLTFEVRGDTTLTITGLENGYPYAVWVRRGCRYAPGGYDTVVWGEWGRYASLYLPPDTTGILAADESGELKVYPNPAHGVLTVDLSEVNDAVVELTLSDLGGREVLRTKAERSLTKVDVSALPAGLYLLQAASPGKVYRRRVAVER